MLRFSLLPFRASFVNTRSTHLLYSFQSHFGSLKAVVLNVEAVSQLLADLEVVLSGVYSICLRNRCLLFPLLFCAEASPNAFWELVFYFGGSAFKGLQERTHYRQYSPLDGSIVLDRLIVVLKVWRSLYRHVKSKLGDSSRLLKNPTLLTAI